MTTKEEKIDALKSAVAQLDLENLNQIVHGEMAYNMFRNQEPFNSTSQEDLDLIRNNWGWIVAEKRAELEKAEAETDA